MQDAVGRAKPQISTLDFLVRLLRWRKLVLLNTGLVALLAVIVSLILPNWYAAQVTILPPQEDQLALAGLSRGLGSALGAASQAALSISGGPRLPIWASPSDYLAGILRSRRLREQVINDHDLIRVYKCDNIDEALKEFSHHIKTRVGGEGIVRVRVEDKLPERAEAITASCLAILDEIQRETRRSRAADVRCFIAERLQATRGVLAAAEESLCAFQQREGLLVPEEQATALIQTVAKVEAERIAAIVERDALTAQVGQDHPEVQRLEALVRSLEEAKSSLEGRSGRDSSVGNAAPPSDAEVGVGPEGPSAIIDLKRLPALSLTYLRLYRELETQAALFELLTQMLEQYRIQEVRDVPTIQVLDGPATPQEKVKPHRAVICIIATLLAFLISLGVAAGLERMAILQEHDPRKHAQLSRLLSGLGLRFLFPRGRM
ncbi:MAG: hypothetical protein KAY24_15470 [Candidatus Eisenbacteria sp.]|nr:hypothetical protein [Candidatus Eisenbacteria bacterium]